MPDLSPVYGYQQCMEWEQKFVKVPSESDPTKSYEVTATFHERRNRVNPFYCDCPAYKFRNMAKSETAMCKHIRAVQGQFCDWHSFCSDEVQTDEQEEAHICPKCGGTTEDVVMMG